MLIKGVSSSFKTPKVTVASSGNGLVLSVALTPTSKEPATSNVGTRKLCEKVYPLLVSRFSNSLPLIVFNTVSTSPCRVKNSIRERTLSSSTNAARVICSPSYNRDPSAGVRITTRGT